MHNFGFTTFFFFFKFYRRQQTSFVLNLVHKLLSTKFSPVTCHIHKIGFVLKEKRLASICPTIASAKAPSRSRNTCGFFFFSRIAFGWCQTRFFTATFGCNFPKQIHGTCSLNVSHTTTTHTVSFAALSFNCVLMDFQFTYHL